MTLYATMRKLHRIFVLVILFLGIAMAVTGLQMKYLPGNAGMANYVHNNMSILFTAVLAIMIVTGAYLYFYPWLMKRKQPKMQSQ